MPLSSKEVAPKSHKLEEVAKFYLQRLPREHQKLMKQSIQACCTSGKPLRIGTLCSGTDAPVPVLANLAKALKGQLEIKHVFSCEFDPKKRAWIQANFPNLKYLFGDVTELHTGKALNYITNQEVAVPAVDIVLAGFVCKSVSTENNEREKYANCIQEKSGKTGETFGGVMSYVRRYEPSIVICENVEGLVKCIKGSEPVINHVGAAFREEGYAFNHRVLDSRDYLLPQRRRRCWMWAFKGGPRQQHFADLAAGDVEALRTTKPWTLSSLFRSAKVLQTAPPRRPLNSREKKVVRVSLKKLDPNLRHKDVIVDVAKSYYRAPVCIKATSCIVPNSRPYRVKTGTWLSAEQVQTCQGIFRDDFPALEKFSVEKECLTRDLAGNAFSTTVCMAVAIACLAHGPLPRSGNVRRSCLQEAKEAVAAAAAAAPGTPPARGKRGRDESPEAATPPRVKRSRRGEVSASASPAKRSKE